MKNLGNPELLAETVFSSDPDFSSVPGIIMPYYADWLGYYTSTFVVMYMAAWATVHQPEGFEALVNCFDTPDEVIFPPGSKHYLHAVVGRNFLPMSECGPSTDWAMVVWDDRFDLHCPQFLPLCIWLTPISLRAGQSNGTVLSQ
jgi:hypothetical protein